LPPPTPATTCFRAYITAQSASSTFTRTYLSYPLDMPSSIPATFDYRGTHPFTDHTKGALPIPPQPSKYPQGVPSTHFNYPQKPQSLPSSQPPSPSGGSLPQYPSQMIPSYSTSSSTSSTPSVSSSKGIFQLYTPDNSGIPELEDILSTKKKQTWSKK